MTLLDRTVILVDFDTQMFNASIPSQHLLNSKPLPLANPFWSLFVDAVAEYCRLSFDLSNTLISVGIATGPKSFILVNSWKEQSLKSIADGFCIKYSPDCRPESARIEYGFSKAFEILRELQISTESHLDGGLLLSSSRRNSRIIHLLLCDSIEINNDLNTFKFSLNPGVSVDFTELLGKLRLDESNKVVIDQVRAFARKKQDDPEFARRMAASPDLLDRQIRQNVLNVYNTNVHELRRTLNSLARKHHGVSQIVMKTIAPSNTQTNFQDIHLACIYNNQEPVAYNGKLSSDEFLSSNTTNIYFKGIDDKSEKLRNYIGRMKSVNKITLAQNSVPGIVFIKSLLENSEKVLFFSKSLEESDFSHIISCNQDTVYLHSLHPESLPVSATSNSPNPNSYLQDVFDQLVDANLFETSLNNIPNLITENPFRFPAFSDSNWKPFPNFGVQTVLMTRDMDLWTRYFPLPADESILFGKKNKAIPELFTEFLKMYSPGGYKPAVDIERIKKEISNFAELYFQNSTSLFPKIASEIDRTHAFYILAKEIEQVVGRYSNVSDLHEEIYNYYQTTCRPCITRTEAEYELTDRQVKSLKSLSTEQRNKLSSLPLKDIFAVDAPHNESLNFRPKLLTPRNLLERELTSYLSVKKEKRTPQEINQPSNVDSPEGLLWWYCVGSRQKAPAETSNALDIPYEMSKGGIVKNRKRRCRIERPDFDGRRLGMNNQRTDYSTLYSDFDAASNAFCVVNTVSSTRQMIALRTTAVIKRILANFIAAALADFSSARRPPLLHDAAVCCICIWFGPGNPFNVSEPIPQIYNPQTNQRAEFYAAIRAVQFFSQMFDVKNGERKNLLLKVNSAYVENSMTEWIEKWVRNGFKNAKGTLVKNRDLFMKLDEELCSLEREGVQVAIVFVEKNDCKGARELAREVATMNEVIVGENKQDPPPYSANNQFYSCGFTGSAIAQKI
ncbi:Ribonuclease H1 [Nowakowskiella sp. JEL0407]|nr:Ribonuclease H1 [Nowakowskiella sp. JEL0407]